MIWMLANKTAQGSARQRELHWVLRSEHPRAHRTAMETALHWVPGLGFEKVMGTVPH